MVGTIIRPQKYYLQESRLFVKMTYRNYQLQPCFV